MLRADSNFSAPGLAMNSDPRPTYTRRQPSISMEQSVVRQPVRDVVLPARPPRSPLGSQGVRWSLMLSAAVGGMGTGAGMMALLMPATHSRQPTPAVANRPGATIPARPEALIAPADNRALVAAILRDGGRVDPFEPSLRDPFMAASQVLPPLPPAPLPPQTAVRKRIPVIKPVAARTQVLPPPALVPNMIARVNLLPLAAVPSGAVMRLPVRITEEQPPRLLDSAIELAAKPLPPLPASGSFVDSPALGTSTLPIEVTQAAQPVLQETPIVAARSANENEQGMKLLGVAAAGEARVAMIRTGPQLSPFSVSVGDTIAGWQVKSIDDSQVVLVQGEQQQVLKLGG